MGDSNGASRLFEGIVTTSFSGSITPFDEGTADSSSSFSIFSTSSRDSEDLCSSCAFLDGTGSGSGAGYAGTSGADCIGGVGSRGGAGGGASITSDTGVEAAAVDLEQSGVSSPSNTERVVFISDSATSVEMGVGLASSGVFDGGGGEGFPRSSGLTNVGADAAGALSPLACPTAVPSDPDMTVCGGVGVEPLRPPDIISSVMS